MWIIENKNTYYNPKYNIEAGIFKDEYNYEFYINFINEKHNLKIYYTHDEFKELNQIYNIDIQKITDFIDDLLKRKYVNKERIKQTFLCFLNGEKVK